MLEIQETKDTGVKRDVGNIGYIRNIRDIGDTRDIYRLMRCKSH